MKNWLMYWLGQLKRWLEHKLENEKEREFRKYLKVLEIRWKEAVRKQQADCPHIAGCNPIWDGFPQPSKSNIYCVAPTRHGVSSWRLLELSENFSGVRCGLFGVETQTFLWKNVCCWGSAASVFLDWFSANRNGRVKQSGCFCISTNPPSSSGRQL